MPAFPPIAPSATLHVQETHTPLQEKNEQAVSQLAPIASRASRHPSSGMETLLRQMIDMQQIKVPFSSKDRGRTLRSAPSNLILPILQRHVALAGSADCLNTPDSLGVTPLTSAIILGDEDAVITLLKLGASVTAVNSDGSTPLEWARDSGQQRLLAVLAERQSPAPAAAILDDWMNSARQVERARQEKLIVLSTHSDRCNYLIRRLGQHSRHDDYGQEDVIPALSALDKPLFAEIRALKDAGVDLAEIRARSLRARILPGR